MAGTTNHSKFRFAAKIVMVFAEFDNSSDCSMDDDMGQGISFFCLKTKTSAICFHLSQSFGKR